MLKQGARVGYRGSTAWPGRGRSRRTRAPIGRWIQANIHQHFRRVPSAGACAVHKSAPRGLSADDGQTARRITGSVWLITQAVGKHSPLPRASLVAPAPLPAKLSAKDCSCGGTGFRSGEGGGRHRGPPSLSHVRHRKMSG